MKPWTCWKHCPSSLNIWIFHISSTSIFKIVGIWVYSTISCYLSMDMTPVSREADTMACMTGSAPVGGRGSALEDQFSWRIMCPTNGRKVGVSKERTCTWRSLVWVVRTLRRRDDTKGHVILVCILLKSFEFLYHPTYKPFGGWGVRRYHLLFCAHKWSSTSVQCMSVRDHSISSNKYVILILDKHEQWFWILIWIEF